MDIIADKSERVTCPFDPVHVIERRRLQTHIIKCKKNLPANHDFVQCRFWALHYIKKSEIDAHYNTCEHALMKQASKRASTAEPSRFKEPKLIYDESSVQSFCDDSWDTPADQPSFRPEDLRAQSSQMIIPNGLSKAKRRECREVERKRLRELEQGEKLAQIEKSWALEIPSGISPSKPLGNQLMIEGQSTGSSQTESVAESSTSGRSNSDSCTGPIRQSHQGMPPPHGIPPPHNNSHGGPPLGRGRGIPWDDDARPSYHPYPYNGIPYRYSPNDFPGL